MTKIGFTGDFCPWQRVEKEFQKGNWEHMFESVLPFFKENDFNIVDLECPLTTTVAGIEKTGPHIKALPETAAILKYLKVPLVATANNHFKDYGWPGMVETYQALEKLDIQYFGSGADASEAAKINYQTFEDTTIGFINVAENEWTTTNGDEPGCNPVDPVAVFYAIEEAKKKADFVVVITHGGHEHYHLPSPRMKKWYRFFVDAGAHAVVGHHTHIISGYEVYNDAPIFYSLGNFCFDWEGLRNMEWNNGMLLRLKFNKGRKIEFEFFLSTHNNSQPGVFLMDTEDQKKGRVKIEQINKIIADDESLNKAFNKYIEEWRPLMQTWMQPYTGKFLPSLFKRGLLPAIMGRRKKLLLTNLARCESHRDILIPSINPEKKII